MIKDFWMIEINRANVNDKTDDDLLYYGSDEFEAFGRLFEKLCKKDICYMLFGKALLADKSTWKLNDKNDIISVVHWIDDDGSDETLND